MSLTDYLKDAIQQCDAELAALEDSRQSCQTRREYLLRLVREIEGDENTIDETAIDCEHRDEVTHQASPVQTDLITREQWTNSFPWFVQWSTVRKKNSKAINEAAITTGRNGVILYSFALLRAAFVAHDPTLDFVLPKKLSEFLREEAARSPINQSV